MPTAVRSYDEAGRVALGAGQDDTLRQLETDWATATLFPNGRTGHDGASSCSAWPTAKWMSSKGEGESFSRRAGNLCHSLPGELVDEVAGVGQRSREALELGQDQGVAVSAGREGHA